MGTRSKTSFSTSTTRPQQMSKIQNRLVVKLKIIELICLINQIICDAPDFRVPFELKVLPILDHVHPITIKLTLAFLNLFQYEKKTSPFYQFTLLRYSRFQNSMNHKATLIFDHNHQKKVTTNITRTP